MNCGKQGDVVELLNMNPEYSILIICLAKLGSTYQDFCSM